MEKLLKTDLDKQQFMDWVGALQSDAFQQGQGALESDPGSYCCLGVGCVVTIPEEELKLQPDGLLLGGYPTAANQPNAPKWLRNISNDFEIKTGTRLSHLNDNMEEAHLTFKEIADKLLEVYGSELGD